MKQELVMEGALANCGSTVSTDDLLRFLEENTEDVHYYKLVPPPGVPVASAFDWQAILGVAASSSAIAQILRAAYKKFVRPLRKKGKDNAYLFITIKNQTFEHIQFSIGTDITDKVEFIRHFSQRVETIRVSPDGVVEKEKTDRKEKEK